MIRTRWFALFILCFSLPATAQGFDVARQDIREFVSDMVRHHQFDRRQLNALLHGAKPQPKILEAIQRPAERTLAWWEYRKVFLTEQRIAPGVALWQQYAADLDRISRDSGVPPEYLLAIVGVETLYGRNTGRYRVLDALATLGFDYPPRGQFFRKELEQFLLMTREEHLDPRQPLGSYAGAMGMPQFMPSSFRRYAVDGNGDGHRDVWQSAPDVFASIANYFREQGWRPGEPVLAEASVDGMPDDPTNMPLTLKETVGSLRQRGYRFDTALPDTASAMLVPAAQESGYSWRIGFQNFYVITRYNRSLLYAMAVHDLAQQLAARYRAGEQAASQGPAEASVAAATP